MPLLTVGALARRSGLTVRTLHHWESVGLLVPSERTDAGHRRYSDADVARLQQVVSLRALGLPLADVKRTLDEGADPAAVVERHRARVHEQAEAARRLGDRLDALVRILRTRGPVATDSLLRIIHLITTMAPNAYYTPEQQAYLRERRESIGESRIHEAEAEWPRLMAEVRAEMEAGTPPADPKVLELARRWRGLVAEFTGGHPGVKQGLNRLYEERRDDMAAMNGQDPAAFRALFAYAGEAQKALALSEGGMDDG